MRPKNYKNKFEVINFKQHLIKIIKINFDLYLMKNLLNTSVYEETNNCESGKIIEIKQLRQDKIEPRGKKHVDGPQ